MNTTAAASYLGLHEGTVRRFATAGVVRGRLTNSGWVFAASDLDAFIESCRVRPGSLSTYFGGAA